LHRDQPNDGVDEETLEALVVNYSPTKPKEEPLPSVEEYHQNEVVTFSDSKSEAPKSVNLRQSSLPQLPTKKQGNQSEIAQQINRISKVVDGMLHDKDREKMKRKIKQQTEQLYAEIPRKRVPLKR
jgi:hypothetical protein